MKIKRSISYIIIALVYAAASGVGIAVFYAFNKSLSVWLSLLIADVCATAFTFIFSLVFKNASVYDPYWSVQPLVILVCFAIVRGLSLSGVLLLGVIALWSVRLTANWAYTFKGMEHQDWRYTEIKEKTGVLFPLVSFVGIHLMPTLVVYLCTMPAVYLIIAKPDFVIDSIAPLMLSIFGIALEAIADTQMHIYKKDRKTVFIEIGVWKHSRHPNYLGEILMWWGVALFCVAHLPSLWRLIVGAFVNTLLFFFVSIPLADGRQSKKEGFEEYYKRTNPLFPMKKAVRPVNKYLGGRRVLLEEIESTETDESAEKKHEVEKTTV